MLRRLFSRKPARPASPGAALAKIGRDQFKVRKRAKVDEMRAAMGLPPVEWPPL